MFTLENDLMINWMNASQTVLPTLLLRHYRKCNLSNDELVLILQLKSYMDKGELFPNTKKIAVNMNMTEDNVFRAIHQLTQKKVLSIETTKDEEGVTQDAYSFSLLWEKLYILMKQEQSEQLAVQKSTGDKNLFTLFEQEFGRTLSSFEMEILAKWMQEDKYSNELIQLALREAVLSQVYNFKYIDRILLNWEKKNIRTKEQVEKESERFRQTSSNSTFKPDDDEPIEPVPMINWLKDMNKE